MTAHFSDDGRSPAPGHKPAQRTAPRKAPRPKRVMPPEFKQILRLTYGAGWRWSAAGELSRQRRKAKDPAAHDRWVRQAAAYRRLAQSDMDAARRRLPNIAAAEAIERNAPLRGRLKIMAVAGMPLDVMQRRTSLDADAIAAWEALFFDVRPWRAARDWVFCEAIEPLRSSGQPELAPRLKFALLAGPAMAERILDADAGIPADEAKRRGSLELLAHMKLDQAIAAPTRSSSEAIRIAKECIRLGLALERLELQKQRLELKRSQAPRRHEIGLERLKRERRRKTQGAQAMGLLARKLRAQRPLRKAAGEAATAPGPSQGKPKRPQALPARRAATARAS